MIGRAAIFFVAVVVLGRSMAIAFQSLLGTSAAYSELGPGLRYLATHVPFAIVVALLMWRANVAPRLPTSPGWYAALAILAAAKVAIFYVSFPGMWAVTAALLAVVVMVMLRLAPRTGDLYQASVMPGVAAFFGFSFLLALSWPVEYGVMLMQKIPMPPMKLPVLLPNLVAAMAVVVVFVMASGIRHRAMQPNPAEKWIWIGVFLAVLVEATTIFLPGVFRPDLLLAERAAAHVMLFIGAFYLLSHLMPRREADELA